MMPAHGVLPTSSIAPPTGNPYQTAVLHAARQPAPSGYRIEIAEGTVGSLHTLLQEWQDLCSRQGTIPPFLAPAWIEPWLRNFAPDASLVIAMIRSDRGLEAVLPFIRSRIGPPLIGIRRLLQPGNVHSVLNDVAAADVPPAVLTRLWDSLRAYGAWDIIDYRSVWEHGSMLALANHARRDGYPVLTRVTHESPYVDLGPDTDLSHLPKARETRRCLRNLERDGTVEYIYQRYPTQDDVLRFARLEAMGWKGEIRTAMIFHENELGFYSGVMTTTTAGYTPVIDELRLNGETIAMSLGIEKHGVFFGVKTSYDPAYRKYGPGNVLTQHIANRLHTSGFRRLEMLGQRDAYKTAWTDTYHTGHHCLVFQNGIRGRLLQYAAHRLIPWLKARRARAAHQGQANHGPAGPGSSQRE